MTTTTTTTVSKLYRHVFSNTENDCSVVVDTSPEMPGSYPVILKDLYLTHSSLDTPFLIILSVETAI